MDEQQRAVLQHLLALDFPGVAELRRQAEVATVDEEDGFGGFTLSVPGDVERAELIDEVPVEVYWRAPDRGALDLLLVAPHGVLAEVEVLRAGYELEQLPPLSEFRTFIRKVKGEKLGGYARKPGLN